MSTIFNTVLLFANLFFAYLNYTYLRDTVLPTWVRVIAAGGCACSLVAMMLSLSALVVG